MLRPSQEKVEAWRFNEEAPAGDAKGLNEDGLPSYDPTEVKRVLRKVDLRLLPMLTALYLLAFLDRGNIGNAKVAGMNAELGLTGTQYNIVLSVSEIAFHGMQAILTGDLRPALFHPLHPLRHTEQYRPQARAAFSLDLDSCYRMGSCECSPVPLHAGDLLAILY